MQTCQIYNLQTNPVNKTMQLFQNLDYMSYWGMYAHQNIYKFKYVKSQVGEEMRATICRFQTKQNHIFEKLVIRRGMCGNFWSVFERNVHKLAY